MQEHDLRLAIITHARALNRLGINQGTSGNLSARHEDSMLITPTGVAYDDMQPGSLARMPLSGADGEWSGPLRPSSEWRFHRDILRARPDVGAVVHTHAPHATALAMLRKPIPAAHYMIAAFGGPTIRCTDYAPFGTQELSDLAVAGLDKRHGVLLGSHGMIATGADLEQALWRAVELEALAKMYQLALSLGTPAILNDDEIDRLVERFKSYGVLAKADDGAR
jgi:L-fuculose-phosphate aldolase